MSRRWLSLFLLVGSSPFVIEAATAAAAEPRPPTAVIMNGGRPVLLPPLRQAQRPTTVFSGKKPDRPLNRIFYTTGDFVGGERPAPLPHDPGVDQIIKSLTLKDDQNWQELETALMRLSLRKMRFSSEQTQRVEHFFHLLVHGIKPVGTMPPFTDEAVLEQAKAENKQHFKLIRYMIEHLGAYVNTLGREKMPLPLLAFLHGDAEDRDSIMELPGIDLSLGDQRRNTLAMYAAAKKEHRNFLFQLMDREDFDPHLKNIREENLASYALDKDDHDLMAKILGHRNFNPNAADRLGNTFSMRAFNLKKYDVVKKLLVDPRLDPQAQNAKGESLISLALKVGDKELLEQLVAHENFDPNAIVYDNKTLATMSVKSKRFSLAKKIINHPNFDPNARGEDGSIIMVWALLMKQFDIVEILLDHEKTDLEAEGASNTLLMKYFVENASPGLFMKVLERDTLHFMKWEFEVSSYWAIKYKVLLTEEEEILRNGRDETLFIKHKKEIMKDPRLRKIALRRFPKLLKKYKSQKRPIHFSPPLIKDSPQEAIELWGVDEFQETMSYLRRIYEKATGKAYEVDHDLQYKGGEFDGIQGLLDELAHANFGKLIPRIQGRGGDELLFYTEDFQKTLMDLKARATAWEQVVGGDADAEPVEGEREKLKHKFVRAFDVYMDPFLNCEAAREIALSEYRLRVLGKNHSFLREFQEFVREKMYDLITDQIAISLPEELALLVQDNRSTIHFRNYIIYRFATPFFNDEDYVRAANDPDLDNARSVVPTEVKKAMMDVRTYLVDKVLKLDLLVDWVNEFHKADAENAKQALKFFEAQGMDFDDAYDSEDPSDIAEGGAVRILEAAGFLDTLPETP